MAATPVKRTQVERRDEAERRLLQAGISLVARHALDGITLKDVGVEAGYSRALLVHYFGSKQTFQARVLEYIASAFEERFLREGEESGLPALVALVNNCFDYSDKDPIFTHILRIMLADPSGDAILMRESLAPVRAKAHALYERRVREGIEAGTIRHDADLSLAVPLMIGALCTALRIAVADRAVEPQAIGNELVQFILRGLTGTQCR